MTAAAPHPEQVGHVVAYLQDAMHVHVAGLRASGRSAVVAHVTERLAALGVSTVAVRGMRALRDRPLGALAVAGVPMASTPHQLRLLTSAVDGLVERLGSPSSVLLVDDADELDSVSMAAIVAAQARLGARVLTTSRPAAHPGMLTDELQPAARIVLDPLPFTEVHRLLHARLGRAVEPTTVARVAAASGGLPGLVVALVDTARRENRLVLRDGVWRARGSLWTTALTQAVDPFLTELSDDDRDALTTLSFAGTVDLPTADDLVGTERLTRLDESGLLQVVSDGDRALVGVFPALVADYLVHESATTRGLLASARIGGARERHASPEVPVGARTATPVVARLFAEHWERRRRSLHQRWRAEPRDANLAADLVEAMQLTHARPHEIADVLAGAGLAEDSPVLATVTGHRHLPPDVLAAADPDLARAARAEAAVAEGRAVTALDLLDGFVPADPRVRRVADTARGLALLYTCDVAGAVSTALAGVERARQELDPLGMLAHSTVAGLALAMQGRALDLEGLVGDALALVAGCPHEPHLRTGLTALAAESATWQGRREFADSLVAQAGPMTGTPGPHPYQDAALIAPLTRDDDDPAVAAAGADRIWRVAQERLAAGYRPAGVLAGVLAVDRFPDPRRAARLREVAAQCEAPMLGHLADYAVAVASGDPAQLAEMEPVLHAAGLRQFAVRAAVARAVRLLADGQPAAAVARADSAWSQGGLRGRDLCGLFLPFDRAVRLTAREREVAVLVARGLSSPEIATRMVLSARTVEHHILSACRKVGVNSRDGLARAARTWLTCTQR